MLKLESLDGELTINDISINSQITPTEALHIGKNYELEIINKSTGVSFYRFSNVNGGLSAIMLIFQTNSLIKVHIGAGPVYEFPAFVVIPEEKKIVKKIIGDLGGESEYPWGSVKYCENKKAGSVYGLIAYFATS